MEQRCLEYLLKTYGKIENSGVLYLAKAVDIFEYNKSIQEIYRTLSEEFNTTPAAIERAIRYYIKNNIDPNQFAQDVDYKLQEDAPLSAAVVIPLLKLYLKD